MKNLLLLCNCNSGKATIRKYIPDMIDYYNSLGYEVVTYITQYRGHIIDIVQKRGEDFDIIVCCGGDGTLNETITGLIKLDNKPVVGYVPCGSTNDFANTLGLPLDIEKAYKNAINGIDFPMDIGVINDRPFTYVSAFGVFTNVSYATSQSMKNVLGHAAYILEGMKQVANIKSYNIRVEYDGGVIEDEFILGFVSNSTKVGGFKIYGNNVDLDDGLFEVILVKKFNDINGFRDFISCFLSSSFDSDIFYVFKTSKIKFVSDEKLDWTVDGEYCGNFEMAEVSILNRAITIKK